MKRTIMRLSPVHVGTLLVVCALALSGCGGGSSGTGVTPAAALAVAVPQGTGNPANVINGATAGMVDITVTLPAGSSSTDVVTVTMSDGQGSEASAQGQGPGVTGGGDVVIQVDASGLADGMIDVTVNAQTSDGQAHSSFQDVFVKDTTPPALPTVLEALDAQGSASAYVNIATTPAASVRAIFAASSSTDVAQVSVRDGATTVNGPIVSGYASPAVSFDGLDLTTLADGAINLDIVVTDPNQNSATLTVAATKDTVAPQAATSAQILASAVNPADVINIATSSSVSVDVGFPADTEARTVRAILSDGSMTAASLPAPAVQAGGTVVLDAIPASLLVDGNVTIVAEMSDLAGNVTSFSGTAASKDTLAPAGPTSAAILAGAANPGSVVNIVSSTSVSVGINWPAFSVGTDTATVSLDMGAASVTSPPGSVPNGGGSSMITGLDASTLGEGIVVVSVTVTELSGNTITMTGTPAQKDTVPPVAPTVARVAGSPANPQDVINIASQNAVGGLVNFPPGTVGDETFTFNINDGATSIMSATSTAPAGGGIASVAALNCGGLVDGFVTVVVTVSDPAQNATALTGTTAMKDTIAPTAPIAASIVAGPGNGPHVINIASAPAASVSVTWPASAPGSETAEVTLASGASVLASVAQAAGGGASTATGIDVTALTDGAVAISVTTTDSAGNIAGFSGTAATKDTVAPASPTAVFVAAGPGNGPHIINIANVSSVSLDLAWPSSASSADTAQVSLTSGGSVGTATTPSNGSGSTTLTGVDASALTDGAVAISVTTTDAAGNPAIFNGTSATKDTVIPFAATSVGVPGGANNPPDWINLATAGTVSIDVTMPAGSTGSETVALSCTDGVATVTTGAQPVTAGGGVINFAGVNLGSLADGAVTITATVTDTAQNSATTNSSGAAKDTVVPANPTSAHVPAGASNPIDMINSATVLSSDVDVAWPGDAGGEAMYVVLSDGVNAQASNPQTLGVGAAAVTFSGLDCSPLFDGSVSLTVTVTDVAWNSGVYGGTTAIKDVVAPAAPVSANVIATPANAVHVINAASAPGVSCTVTFAAGGSSSDVASLTLSDGVTGVSTPTQTVMPGGAVTYAGTNTTTLGDGTVSVSVNVIDAAGNLTVWSGTAASKDTVAPSAATQLDVAAGSGNDAGIINASSQGAVSFDVTVPPESAGTDVRCSVSDGTTMVTSAPAVVPVGGGAMIVGGLSCSTLGDGTMTVTATLTDAAGNVSTFSGTCTKDAVGPVLHVDPVTTPTAQSQQTLTGETESAAAIEIAGGAVPAGANADALGRFGIVVPLTVSATNSITVTATDAAGNPTVRSVDFATSALTIVQSPTAPPVMFTDVTVASGLAATSGAAGGSFQDLDNDGDLDLFVGGSNTMWRNDGFGSFTDVTTLWGGPFAGGSSAAFSDYDNDGDLDLAVISATACSLWENALAQGVTKFVDVTAMSGAGAAGSLGAAFWADLDGDGLNDLVVTDSDPTGPEVRRNLGAGVFASLAPFSPTTGTMRFGVVADFVQNGLADFVFGDAAPSFFWRNDGSMAFTDIAGATSNVSIDQSGAAGGMIAADYDNDGDLDLFVAAGGALAPSASCGGCMIANNQVFRNDGTSAFTAQVGGLNVAFLAGIEPSDGWRDLCAGDVNNDGRLDLVAVQANTMRLFLNVGDATASDGVWEFVESAGACGISGTNLNDLVQMADIDGDGDLDLFAPNAGGTNVVYRNDVNNRRNLTVRVRGSALGAGYSTRDAIGARVELLDASGGIVLASREVSGGRGLGSQDPLQVHFGTAPSWVYTVRVTFPSGKVTTVSNVVPRMETNQTMTVDEQ